MTDPWFNIRSGLSDISKKLTTATRKIAYLGNSLTAQKNGYRFFLHNRLIDHFKQNHQSVNAGMGGVGSMACSFLLNDFVIRHHPDLCFIECSVADAGSATPLAMIGPAVEGMIRQLKKEGIAICILYLYRTETTNVSMQEVIAIYEKIAEHYQIPSINIHSFLSDKIERKDISETDIVYDGIHTTEFGAGLTAEQILQAFKTILHRESSLIAKEDPMYETALQFVNIMPADPSMLELEKPYFLKRFKLLISYLEFDTLNTLKCSCTDGNIIGFFVVADRDSGVIEVGVGNSKIAVQLFDEWCDKERIQAVLLKEPIPANKEIIVSLSDQSTGEYGANGEMTLAVKKAANVKIIGFMVHHHHATFHKNKLW